MRVKKHISILSLFFFLLLACDTENNQDTTPPGILTIDSIVPTNGGGIINYSQKEDGFNFDGECYVFDSRQSIPVNNVNPSIITKCYICDDASTDITNCRYTVCNRQTVICKKCSIKFDGFCCIECKNIGYSSEKLRYMPFN